MPQALTTEMMEITKGRETLPGVDSDSISNTRPGAMPKDSSARPPCNNWIECSTHQRWLHNLGHTGSDQHASGKPRDSLLNPLPIRRPLSSNMSRSVSEYGHYDKTCMKAVQTEVPARCCMCSKLLVKDASVQCDLGKGYVGKAKSVTFSLGIELRGDTPDKPQLR